MHFLRPQRFIVPVVASFATVMGACSSGIETQTYIGTTQNVTINGGIAMVTENGASHSFNVGDGVEWLGTDNSWREHGTSECLPPMSRGAKIVVKAIRYEGRQRVMRVECKSLPTAFSWTKEDGPASDFTAYCTQMLRKSLTPTMVDNPCTQR